MSLSDRPALRVTATPAEGNEHGEPGRNRLARLLSGWADHARPVSAPRPLLAGKTEGEPADTGCELLADLVPLPVHLLRGVRALPTAPARRVRRPGDRSQWSRAIRLEIDAERLLGELESETRRALLNRPLGPAPRPAQRFVTIGM